MLFNRNEDIRKAIKDSGLPCWAIAEKVLISETSFYRWMRKELEPERKATILAAIEELKKERD